MKNENPLLFHGKLPGKKCLLFPWVLTGRIYNPCENKQCLNACSPQCISVDSWPFGFSQNAKCICWSYGTPSLWPSFFQKDCILPERTGAIALIEAFTLQLGQSPSEMQLG